MNPISYFHSNYVHVRRVRVLSEVIERVLAGSVSVLDIGCGDGLLAREVMKRNPDRSMVGVDVLVREDALIDVVPFDGSTLPFEDDSFDAVILIDVLHHCDDPKSMLIEAQRVARRSVIIKDHLVEGRFAWSTLKFMDRTSNAKHGVALPHNYWTRLQWQAAFDELNWEERYWSEAIPLYPWPASMIFGRSLHFVGSFSIDNRVDDSAAKSPVQ